MSAIDDRDRARIGFLVSPRHRLCEAELPAMMPPGVAALVTRLEPLRMTERLAPAGR